MEQDLKEFLKRVCRNQSRAIVGKLLKRLELLEDSVELTEKQKFHVLKSFCRELIYENFRDLRNSVIFYSEGRDYKKLPIYNPTKDLKSWCRVFYLEIVMEKRIKSLETEIAYLRKSIEELKKIRVIETHTHYTNVFYTDNCSYDEEEYM